MDDTTSKSIGYYNIFLGYDKNSFVNSHTNSHLQKIEELGYFPIDVTSFLMSTIFITIILLYNLLILTLLNINLSFIVY